MLPIAFTLALGAALVFAAIAWRLRRLEQQRSAARVAALTAAIDDGPVTLDAFTSRKTDALVERSLVSLFAPEVKPATNRVAFAVGALVVLAATIVLLLMSSGGAGTHAGKAAQAPRVLLSCSPCITHSTTTRSSSQASSKSVESTHLLSRPSFRRRPQRQVAARQRSCADRAGAGEGNIVSVTVTHDATLAAIAELSRRDDIVPHVDRL
jgi:hypothetical protein